MEQCQGIECALWPNLYPFTSWCESVISGSQSRESSKKSFWYKVQSSILDYSLDFDLLLFHYDRWLFKTVTGAITTARRFKCSPARSLDDKTFSPEYWKWQHCFLLDAVRQYGLPSVFVTISPYEWTFPFPPWLQNLRPISGKGPTNLAAFETAHIAHILEQVIRGYLTGSNTERWTQHIFNNNGLKRPKNISTYFYRFQFQKRGTVHVHLLVWLKYLSRIQYSKIRADIPLHDVELGFLAERLQKSNTRSPFLHLQDDESYFDESNNESVLHLRHPKDAFELNLRAYISTLLPALKCRMDFQTADGNAMVLKYVCSYVSKTQDSFSTRGLYSTFVSPLQAAYRHMSDMSPCEPEMWMSFCGVKMSWSSSGTKRFIAPSSTVARDDATIKKYFERPANMENLSLLLWLRAVNHTSAKPKPYKDGNRLVGVKYLSWQNPNFFFQYVIMNTPTRDFNILDDKRYSTLPFSVRYFAPAAQLHGNLFGDEDAIRKTLSDEGNKNTYIDTTVAYINSLHDVLTVCRLNLVDTLLFEQSNTTNRRFPPDGPQSVIVNRVISALQSREDENILFASTSPDIHDDEDVSVQYASQVNEPVSDDHQTFLDWKQPLLVTGKPGSGKTYAVLSIVEHCINLDYSVLVTAPTGFLASKYSEIFKEQADTDTVHAAFKYPVNEAEKPAINWNLVQYDFIVIDEISMLPSAIFQHVLRTLQELPRRPVILVSGDNAQQQPIVTVDGRTTQTTSALSDAAFLKMACRFPLETQYRCVDPMLQRILDHVRYWKANSQLLDALQAGRVLCNSDDPGDDEITRVIQAYPEHTFLTISRKPCNRVNQLVLHRVFNPSDADAQIQYDCDLPISPVYSGMKVMITQNRNKSESVVNGQLATVHSFHNNTMFLTLPNGRVVNTYPVTYTDTKGVTKTVYPFMPAYALTICKAQGQTLNTAIIWFDINFVPAATGYVAISRVKKLDNMLFLTPLKQSHFKPNLVADTTE